MGTERKPGYWLWDKKGERRTYMQKLWQLLKREWEFFWWARAKERQKKELELKIEEDRVWPTERPKRR
tara:strand:+ start:3193 stop:3396 length:204 start_codon:yes stop_codon:yes gene_type:complete